MARHSEDAAAHYGLGLALQHMGRIVESAAHYQLALTHRPDHAEAALNLAALHHRFVNQSGDPGRSAPILPPPCSPSSRRLPGGCVQVRQPRGRAGPLSVRAPGDGGGAGGRCCGGRRRLGPDHHGGWGGWRGQVSLPLSHGADQAGPPVLPLCPRCRCCCRRATTWAWPSPSWAMWPRPYESTSTC